MKTVLARIAALLFCAVSLVILSASAAELERLFFEKTNVTLVVMIANSDCCDYVGGIKATGWKSTPSKTENQYTCYLTIGEVDIALACYQGHNQGRIGTEVINTDPKRGFCPINTVTQLIGPDINSIIQDFEQNGYPDGCNADGCGDGGLSSGGDGEAPSE